MSKPEFFNDLSLPAVAAPMFLISGPRLVIECCKNGIVGTFPALNQRTTEGFEEWVIQIKTELEEFEKQTGKKVAGFMRAGQCRPEIPRIVYESGKAAILKGGGPLPRTKAPEAEVGSDGGST